MCARPPFTLLSHSNTAVDSSANGALIGTDTTSPYSIAWSGIAAGTYTLTAKATDNSGAESTRMSKSPKL